MRRYRVDQYGRPIATRGLGSLRDMEHIAPPMPDGSPGNDVYPYDESLLLNPAALRRGGASAPAAAPALSYGPNLSKQSRMSSVPLAGAFPGSVPIVNANALRNFLLIQNNSTATSPDTAPTLYVTFDAPASGAFGSQLALPPLTGVFFDDVVPINAIFIAIGPFSNGGGTSQTLGVLIQGLALAA